MRGLPSSLRGRTLALMLGAMLACQMLTLGMLGVYRHNFLGNRGRDYMATHMMLVREALRFASPPEIAHDLEQIQGRRIRLIESPPPSASADPPSLDVYPSRLVETLRQDYGADAVRFSEVPDLALYVRVSPSGWWMMIPSSRFEVPIPWTTVVATLSAAGMMALLVVFYVLHLSNPLHRLAEAAQRFEVGQRPQLPLTGPDEVRAVTSQFNDMAERLAQNDAERRVMLAGLPHDLRAPLARTKLRLALMEEADRAGFERDLAEIERIADQFVAYLRGLDHDTSRFTPVNLGELLHDRAQAWQGAGQEVTNERIDAVTVQGDAGALERAVDNLISNAFAHGAAPVRLRGIANGESYSIEIEDHGPGIAEEDRAEVIRPFVRLDSARGAAGRTADAAQGGTQRAVAAGGHCGLGLAVVQAVSKLHGGLVATMVLPIEPGENLPLAA
jgi:two-component system osmolarity sensor histidine kinase EnvZ